jgi:hypothetical protein
VNEHDFCGPPLVAQTGFSYDPELLMRNKSVPFRHFIPLSLINSYHFSIPPPLAVFYYNFAIPDFGTLPSQSILNIVKVIWFSLRHGEFKNASPSRLTLSALFRSSCHSLPCWPW